MTTMPGPMPPGYAAGYTSGYGPFFDGRFTHNTTTNPGLNALFDMTHMTQASFEQSAMFNNYARPGYDPNLAFYYSMIQPGVSAAYNMTYGPSSPLSPPPPGTGTRDSAGHGGDPGASTDDSNRSLGKTAKYAAIGGAIGAGFGGVGAPIGAAIGALASLF